MDRYAKRGVSSDKSEVHEAIKNVDPGIFPDAFCKVTPDHLTGDPNKCNIIHADGSGTKSILAYIYYKVARNASVFKGIAQDSIVMNIDDLMCVGVDTPILISSTINRNALSCPQEVITNLIEGTEEFIEKLNGLGVEIHSGGGETADVGDLTGTVTVDTTAVAVMNRLDVINGSRITPGLAIVGLSSTGQASYESEPNSGIGSNGLTNARHDLLDDDTGHRFPETINKFMDPEYVYTGSNKIFYKFLDEGYLIDALLSPTRTYAPVIQWLVRRRPDIVRGIIHCTGGGQTKCLNFGENIHYDKKYMFAVPPIMRLIREESGVSWEEMYKVFNMGHRMEVLCPREDADIVIEAANEFNIEAQIIGYTEPTRKTSGKGNTLTIHGPVDAYHYSK